uniref:Uncharacterized protein n=1 Tax=Leersia perrieri TaxID=77586 RepID=A0A0D9XGC4_9ORYZ
MLPTSDMMSPPGSKLARASDGSASGKDVFGCLPDELIHHVLSFLPMVEAVRTSVLARRWRNLWVSMPCLNVDFDDFDNEPQFESFMAQALPLLDDTAPLRTFRLRSLLGLCSSLWISHAIKRKVAVLEYSEHPTGSVHDGLNLASSYLTKLVLKHVELDAYHFGPLNNACSVLETLELLSVFILDSGEISSSSLKHLRVVSCLFESEFRICTPNLLTMCLDDIHGFGSLALENLSSLTTASISAYDCFFPEGDIQIELHILDGLSHARNLKLVAPLHEALFDVALPTCLVFSNLKCLVLGDWCMAFDLYPLRCVLKQSPMLEELCVELRDKECKDCKERAPDFSHEEILPFRISELLLLWHGKLSVPLFLNSINNGYRLQRHMKTSIKVLKQRLGSVDMIDSNMLYCNPISISCVGCTFPATSTIPVSTSDTEVWTPGKKTAGKMSRRRQPQGSVSGDGDDDDDDSFLYRYPLPSAAAAPGSSSSHGGGGGGSGGLAPSKSTVYVSNLDYSLTNSDLHTLFSRFGRVARVTVLKDRGSRRSRGVAFVLFVRREDAAAAAAEMHGKVLNGRTLSASIAEDNGRAAEFIRRRVYRDKSRCYECGEEGHLSYECPRNQLGPRERPPPSKKSRRGGGGGGRGASWQSDDEEESAMAFEDDKWASVVDTRGEEEEKAAGKGEGKSAKKKKEKRKGYFSDESDEDED